MAKKHAKRAEQQQKQETSPVQPLPHPNVATKTMMSDNRQHVESLGATWTAVSGLHPQVLIPQVIPTVMQEGGTRPSWQWKEGGKDYLLMAWPKDMPLRASVLFAGKEGEQMRPVSCVPLLEGLPNDLTVASVHAWEEGCGANVGVNILEPERPMWFYDPFYTRDKTDLTEGVTHTFLLAALAFGVRRALLDEITITQGPAYEAYAQAWLEENPGKTRLDVPPLQVNVAGKHIIQPGNSFSEYQMRAKIQDIDTCSLDTMPISILYTQFPMPEGSPLTIPVYVAKVNLRNYEPKVGDEIDAYVWFQGRVIDWDGAAVTSGDGVSRGTVEPVSEQGKNEK